MGWEGGGCSRAKPEVLHPCGCRRGGGPGGALCPAASSGCSASPPAPPGSSAGCGRERVTLGGELMRFEREAEMELMEMELGRWRRDEAGGGTTRCRTLHPALLSGGDNLGTALRLHFGDPCDEAGTALPLQPGLGARGWVSPLRRVPARGTGGCSPGLKGCRTVSTSPHSPGACAPLCIPSPPSGASPSPPFPPSASSLCCLPPSSPALSSSPSLPPSRTASPLLLSVPPASRSPQGSRPHGSRKAQHRRGSWAALIRGQCPGRGSGGWGTKQRAPRAGYGRAEPALSCPPGASGFLPPPLPLSPEVPGDDGGPRGQRLSGGGARAGGAARSA